MEQPMDEGDGVTEMDPDFSEENTETEKPVQVNKYSLLF